jgi:hypothetical protein
MSQSFFDTLPLDVKIRQGAVAVLKSQATIAGLNVQDSPIDPVPDDVFAQINIFSKEQRTGRADAGGRPGFWASLTLQIQMIYRSTDAAAAVLQTDIMRKQVRDALFEDPVWIGSAFAPPPTDIEEMQKHTRSGELYLVEHITAITLRYIDNYGARTGSVLGQAGAPGLPKPVIQPLQKVVTTIVAGQAGTPPVPTEFVTETLLPPP